MLWISSNRAHDSRSAWKKRANRTDGLSAHQAQFGIVSILLVSDLEPLTNSFKVIANPGDPRICVLAPMHENPTSFPRQAAKCRNFPIGVDSIGFGVALWALITMPANAVTAIGRPSCTRLARRASFELLDASPDHARADDDPTLIHTG